MATHHIAQVCVKTKYHLKVYVLSDHCLEKEQDLVMENTSFLVSLMLNTPLTINYSDYSKNPTHTPPLAAAYMFPSHHEGAERGKQSQPTPHCVETLTHADDRTSHCFYR